MTETIKYTSDGRKVIVVGKLNATQHIVQEIFVTNGQEIPSGENFVVASLHDAPAESWKEKELRELEQRYEKTRKDIKRRTDALNEKIRVAEEKAKHRASALLAFARNSDDSQLQRLHAFLAGEVTHFFVNSYRPEIVDWTDNKVYDTDSWYSRLRVDGMKLVSLLGNYEGKLSYRLHEYRDGSGGGGVEVIPCRSYDEALIEAQQELDRKADLYMEGKYNHWSPDTWAHIEGIVMPEDARQKFAEAKRKNAIARAEKLRKELAAIEAEIAK